jgi:hypothetical protein
MYLYAVREKMKWDRSDDKKAVTECEVWTRNDQMGFDFSFPKP